MRSIDSKDLNEWSGYPECKSALPLLFRRLLIATTNEVTGLDIPAGSSVNLDDWDGKFELKTDTPFLKKGSYLVELSCSSGVKKKADDDFNKRTKATKKGERSKTTYVYVTSRSYRNKSEWVKEKKKNKAWKDVLFLDSHNLAQWLDLSPVEKTRLLREIGKTTDANVIPAFEYWNTWSSVSKKILPPNLVVAGRNDIEAKIVEWLERNPTTLELQGETKDEAVAFLCASVERTGGPLKESFYSRAVVVTSRDAWYQLEKSKHPLVLIPYFQEEYSTLSALALGHHIYIPREKGDGISPDFVLRKPRRDHFREELEKMGLSKPELSKVLRSGGNNLLVVRRRLSNNLKPGWSSDEVNSKLIPAVLVGGWSESEEDLKILTKVSGSKIDKLLETYQALSLKPDSPIRKVGRKWELVSHDESWEQLYPLLTETQIKNFSDVAIQVLGTISPEYDLKTEERFYAGIKGKVQPYGSQLRDGIAETLALMGSTTDGSNADMLNAYTKRTVKEIFKKSSDWRLWATLSSQLSTLAEAAPEELMDAIDAGLKSRKKPFLELFKQEGDGFMGGCYHSGLLWALETLAWSPDYFSRVSLLLARLAVIDPGGTFSNRPRESLRAIFLGWKKYCSSSNKERLKVIDLLFKHAPGAAWNLLVDLCPSGPESITDRSTPKWRVWGQDVPETITQSEYQEYLKNILVKMTTYVSDDLDRWKDLINNIAVFPQERRLELYDTLSRVISERKDPNSGGKLRVEMRDMLNRHKSYPDAGWALPEKDIAIIEQLYQQVTPKDLVQKHAWVFDYWPTLPVGERRTDEKYRSEVTTLQDQAIKEIHSKKDKPLLKRLIDSSPGPEDVGKALGRVYGFNREIAQYTFASIKTEERNEELFALGVYASWYATKKWKHIEAVLQEAKKISSNTNIVAFIYLGCPANRFTWEKLEKENPAAQESYWKKVTNTFRFDVENTEEDYNYGLGKLLEVGRAMDVVEVASYSEYTEKTAILVKALQLLPLDMNQAQKNKRALRTNSHSIARVFEKLDSRNDIKRDEIAKLEIPLVKVLTHDRPSLALHDDVLDNPKTFADLISWTYKPKKGYKDDVSLPKKQKENMAMVAWEILHHIPRLPGQTSKKISKTKLRKWVKDSIKLCSESGRKVVGEHHIGDVLSKSPVGKDGVWPCEEARDVLEEIISSNPEVKRGFEMGTYNGRGMTSRGVYDGGEQEKVLYEHYYDYSRTLSSTHPNVSRMLKDIAEDYKAEGKRHDREADLEE